MITGKVHPFPGDPQISSIAPRMLFDLHGWNYRQAQCGSMTKTAGAAGGMTDSADHPYRSLI